MVWSHMPGSLKRAGPSRRTAATDLHRLVSLLTRRNQHLGERIRALEQENRRLGGLVRKQGPAAR